jgi:hypothetical protein
MIRHKQSEYGRATAISASAMLLMMLVLAGVAVILALQAAPGLVGVGVQYSHGVEKHGSDTLRTRKCLNDKGSQLTMLHPKTGRFAEVCELELGIFGVRISEEIDGLFEELTAFSEEGELWDIEEYLIRRGYMPTH